MKTRVISAIAAILLLIAVICLGEVAIGLTVCLLATLAVREFNSALEKGGFRPVEVVSFASCVPLLYIAVSGILPSAAVVSGSSALLAAAVFAFVLLVSLFCFMMFSDGKYGIRDVSATLLGMIYIPFLFSFVTLTRQIEAGHLYIWLIFIGASATDTFAFFTGITIGKRKIVPKISPNKTLEGCIGGVIGCIIAVVAFGAVFKNSLDVSYLHFAILGLICGIISQLGDWSASVIKRAVGIKDFGNIMPGHGGVLDRIDSILFTAPAVYFYINIFF
ncbi:MAG TPA: phosphatidate cytidylyltransferase [Clostridiales bacterium]|nr:phosphatidate cytidylyltransferase [Clostridiales bacterium]